MFLGIIKFYGIDSFTLEATGALSNFTGGSGADVLTINAMVAQQTIELGNRNTTSLNVFQIEGITANPRAGNTLKAPIS